MYCICIYNTFIIKYNNIVLNQKLIALSAKYFKRNLARLGIIWHFSVQLSLSNSIIAWNIPHRSFSFVSIYFISLFNYHYLFDDAISHMTMIVSVHPIGHIYVVITIYDITHTYTFSLSI